MSILSDWYDKAKQERLHRNAQLTAKMSISASSSKRYLLYGILRYYEERKLRWPTLEEALEWANTESGEVSEILLARVPGWVRNNPDKHKKPDPIVDKFDKDYELMEEISDQVFMLLVAGMVCGFDVLEIMRDKMERKLGCDPALIGFDL